MAYLGGIFFANMGGGGGQNYLQTGSGEWKFRRCPSTVSYTVLS